MERRGGRRKEVSHQRNIQIAISAELLQIVFKTEMSEKVELEEMPMYTQVGDSSSFECCRVWMVLKRKKGREEQREGEEKDER